MFDRRELSLRPVVESDQAFLFELYQSTRSVEARALGLDGHALEAFMRLQFSARNRGYRAAFPHAEQSIVMLAGQTIGMLWVDRQGGSIRLVDIALGRAFRGSGIGTSLLGDLQREASQRGCPLYLHVVKSSRAARFYERLGFVAVDPDVAGPHIELNWQPETFTSSPLSPD
ncbi:MAG TPA: GNAT family N-acetyltransferase [Polyangiaceae bacterium]|nr:GNAT family N-acetyltransferase [Polyangiaceae bacterium]